MGEGMGMGMGMGIGMGERVGSGSYLRTRELRWLSNVSDIVAHTRLTASMYQNGGQLVLTVLEGGRRVGRCRCSHPLMMIVLVLVVMLGGERGGHRSSRSSTTASAWCRRRRPRSSSSSSSSRRSRVHCFKA